jgi:hypothetical protein
MDNETIIKIIVAVVIISTIAYLPFHKTKEERDKLIKQNEIDPVIANVSEDDIDPLQIKTLEVLSKISNNTSTIKSILIFFLVVTLLSVLIWLATLGIS